MSVWRYDVRKDLFSTIFGYPVCGNNHSLEQFYTRIHPQDLPVIKHELNNLINHKGISSNFIVRLSNKENPSGFCYYKIDAIIEKDNHGHLRNLVGIERNVTYEKLCDTEYQNVLISLNLSLKASKMVVWYYDVDSDMFYKLIGNDYVATRNIHDLLSYSLPASDRSEVQNLYQDLLSGKLGDYHGLFQLMQPNDADYRTYECNFATIKDSVGNVIKVAGTLLDITDKHKEHQIATESNKRFTLAMKTSNFVLWEYDCESQQITAFNEPLNKFDDQKKLTIIDYIHFLHPDDVEKLVPINEHLNMRHDVNFSVDLRFKDEEEGEWQYYTFMGAPFERDDFGRITKFAGIRKNNTHFIKLNNELKEAKEKAERSDRLKTVFLANMTHEVRTPLNAIVGFSQLLMASDNHEEQERFCTIISQNNNALLTIFNDIIDLSRIEAGFVDFTHLNFDMAVQIESLKDIFIHKMPENVELVIDNPYTSFEVVWDWNRLVQIYTNFVNNACKYTMRGSITIGYRLHKKGMKIFCRDTGKGIALEDQKRIFSNFEKVDSYVQGLGLGLSLCNAIVKAAGGYIGVQSEPGVGSLFWVVIPCDPTYELKNGQNIPEDED